jgi:ATP-dependent exoDNAse (exonuclease V) beta subunit
MERDERITFLEEPHIYLIDGKEVPKLQSVTQFVHTFFSHFNADQVITNMMKSKNWPNSKYFGMSSNEIKQGWDIIRDEAANAGTKMHLAIEQFYNHQIDSSVELDQDKTVIDTDEYRHFEVFFKDYQHLKPFKTEWRIFDEKVKIAGSIDMIFLDPDDDSGKSLYIFDWKRSKCINTSNIYQKALYPISHLDDCNYIHYTLQLNVYRKIIQDNYGYKVNKLAIVVFHPNNPSYQIYELDILDDVMEKIWQHRLKQLNL